MIAYRVLRGDPTMDGPPVTWREVADDSFQAHSAEAAIRDAVGDEGGLYVAVPARSWKPVTVTVETTRQLKLGPVTEPKSVSQKEGT